MLNTRANRDTVKTLVELKNRYDKRSREPKITEDALLNEIATEYHQQLLKLAQIPSLNFSSKLMAVVPFMSKFCSRIDLLKFLTSLEHSGKMDKNTAEQMCRHNNIGKTIPWSLFEAACKELGYE